MSKVSKGRVVSLDYRLHLGDGQVVDQSTPGNPLSYMHGQGQIIPGLEGKLEGMGVGDAKQVTVQPGDGYGEYDAAGVQEVPRAMFPPNADLRVGVMATAQTPQGEIPFVIKEVKADSVVIDLNHPLAGKTLHFDVTVREVRDATAEELEHGHAHGPGGHHE